MDAVIDFVKTRSRHSDRGTLPMIHTTEKFTDLLIYLLQIIYEEKYFLFCIKYIMFIYFVSNSIELETSIYVE